MPNCCKNFPCDLNRRPKKGILSSRIHRQTLDISQRRSTSVGAPKGNGRRCLKSQSLHQESIVKHSKDVGFPKHRQNKLALAPIPTTHRGPPSDFWFVQDSIQRETNKGGSVRRMPAKDPAMREVWWMDVWRKGIGSREDVMKNKRIGMAADVVSVENRTDWQYHSTVGLKKF